MGRPVRGSREFAFYSVPQCPSLSTLNSAFQLQEYIAHLVRLDPHDVQRIVMLPASGTKDADPRDPSDEERPAVDEACWIYEQLRRLAQDLTHPLITTLQQECTRQTCPEMKAGEWLYLCVAHGNTGGMEQCCAIDYIVHTLDSATALLNSPRAFPSRISIPPASHRHFPSLARRLGRIFAHAYYHHRAAFESAEADNALYARFLALSRRFDLVPAEFLVIPAHATDPGPVAPAPVTETAPAPAPTRITLLTREAPAASPEPAASPRLGGRARTGTMYLSGDFAGPAAEREGVSPRRASTPLADPSSLPPLPPPPPPPPPPAVLAQDAGLPKVLVRDFALPPETEPAPLLRVGEGASEDAVEMEEMEEEEGGVRSRGASAGKGGLEAEGALERGAGVRGTEGRAAEEALPQQRLGADVDDHDAWSRGELAPVVAALCEGPALTDEPAARVSGDVSEHTPEQPQTDTAAEAASDRSEEHQTIGAEVVAGLVNADPAAVDERMLSTAGVRESEDAVGTESAEERKTTGEGEVEVRT